MLNAMMLAAGTVLLMLQCVIALVLPSEHLTPSLVLPLVLFMAVGEISLARGVMLSFVVGYLTDAFSGGSLGLWTFTLVSVFLFARVAGLKLFLHGAVFQVALTFAASLLAGIEMMALLLVFDRRPLAVLSALGVVCAQGVATAACAPAVFSFLRRLPGTAAPTDEAAG